MRLIHTPPPPKRGFSRITTKRYQKGQPTEERQHFSLILKSDMGSTNRIKSLIPTVDGQTLNNTQSPSLSTTVIAMSTNQKRHPIIHPKERGQEVSSCDAVRCTQNENPRAQILQSHASRLQDDAAPTRLLCAALIVDHFYSRARSS